MALTMMLPYGDVDSTLRAIAGRAEGFGRLAIGGFHGPLYFVTTLSAKLATFKSFASQFFNLIFQHCLLCSGEESQCQRRPLLLGIGALTANLQPTKLLFAEGIHNHTHFYRTDTELLWTIQMVILMCIPQIGRALDSAFKDRYLQLQNVRVRFMPTEKKDIRDMGPLEEVITFLVNHRYAAPNQRPTIYDMQERTIDGKHYYTVEYVLTSPDYSSASIATIAIGNGRYYTLIVGANERRWKRFRNQLKVVADSFRLLDI